MDVGQLPAGMEADDFNDPAGGNYDLWIASGTAQATISGTMYMTENAGNHP